MTTRKKNPTLRRLDALVGTWETSVIVGDQTMTGGRTVFTWQEGEGILQQWSDADTDGWSPEWVANSPLPTSAAIGLEDRTGRFFMLYSDARGVCRLYETSLDGGLWKIWGHSAEDFYQRFEGRISDDGRTITAYWEKSSDGSTWARDFDMKYAKVD